MSITHSDATSETALQAFKLGFSHVTHLYSATPSIHKIDQEVRAGVVEAAYLSDDTSIELIADGRHVAADAFRLALKIKGSERIALISDALRPAGTTDSTSWLGEKTEENRVIIEDGVAKLPDRSSYAGSIATGIDLLRNAVQYYQVPLVDSIKMLTETPARIMNLEHRGFLEEGNRADVVLFDDAYNIRKVILNGKVV